MNLEIQDDGLNTLSHAIAETGITPLIHRQPGKGFTILEFENETDYAVMKVKLCLWLWTGKTRKINTCPPV